jgi:peptidoglycan/LPS O-acetylase OafA/YrhL
MCAAAARWRLGHRPALDGLRGVAVLTVLADHSGFLPEPTGGIGVALFFVLSGFLITRVIVEAREDGAWSFGGFLANRFFRLFPALLVMVAVVSVVLLARGYSPAGVVERAAPPLAYVQNMFRPLSLPVFGHTWSLGVEEQFYLLWPLVLPWFVGRTRPRLLLGLAILGSAALMVAVPRDWLPMHAYALLAGCALALLGPPRRQRWLLPIGAAGFLAAIAVAPSYHQIYVYGPMTATPAAVLLVVGAVHGNRGLELTALRFVGRISYALYLWHVPLLRLTGTTYAGPAALLPLAAAFLVASASTLLFEEPVRRAWRHRPAQRAVGAATTGPVGSEA